MEYRVIGAAGLLMIGALLAMQDEGRGQGRANQPPVSAKAAAPFDPTGYWSSLITQNWRLRMVPPGKGDYIGIPISAAGKKAADAWDQAKDEAAGNQCKAYGSPGLMNLPTHLHITWQDDNTLRVDTDAGTQTRVFPFGKATALQGKRTWQGSSVAVWEARRARANNAAYLKVTTTNMLPGWLRRNGAPYSQNAVITEHYTRITNPDAGDWFVVTTVVDDPQYLQQPFITSSNFKKEPNDAKWSPSACKS